MNMVSPDTRNGTLPDSAYSRKLAEILSNAVQEITGRKPELSTTGGTSDARFIKDYCPVIEFGMTGETMHKIDENVPTADIEKLSRIYERLLERFFA